MHALTLDHLIGRPGRPRHGRERPAGRRGLVRPAVLQAAGPHPRGRRHHPPGAGPRGAGDQRRPALPAAVRRRGRRSGSASRSSRSCTRCARTSRSGSAPRDPRTSPRPPRSPTAGSRSSTRRSRRACTSRGSTRGSPGRARGVPAPTSRSRPPATSRSSPSAEEKAARHRRACKPLVALYMGGMGAKEQNFHKQVFDRMGYEAITERGAGALPGRRRRTGHRADPRRAGRRHAHRRHRRRGARSGSPQWEETGVTTLLLSLPLGRRGAADRGDAGVSGGAAMSEEAAQRPGGGAAAVRDRPGHGLLPRRLLQRRAGGPRQPHHLRGGDRRVPRPPAQHRQRPDDARRRSTEFAGLHPGDRWCVTAANWARAHDDGAAAPVVLASTNAAVLKLVPLDVLQRYAVDVPGDLSGLDEG